MFFLLTCNTEVIFIADMTCVWTFRQIADFRKLGTGVWYETCPNGLIFHDGPDDAREREGMKLQHFRYL